MSHEFFPSARIPYDEFGRREFPSGLAKRLHPRAEQPEGPPRPWIVENDDSTAVAWPTRPFVGEIGGGTYFELFGANMKKGRGGIILFAIGRIFGVHIVHEWGADIVTEAGDIDADNRDEAIVTAADVARWGCSREEHRVRPRPSVWSW